MLADKYIEMDVMTTDFCPPQITNSMAMSPKDSNLHEIYTEFKRTIVSMVNVFKAYKVRNK